MFIPIPARTVCRWLLDDSRLSSTEKTSFERFYRDISFRFHGEFHERLESLKANYGAFDPDVDPAAVEPATSAAMARTFSEFDELLTRANYRRLPHETIVAALESASEWGVNLDLDFTIFDRIELYARGDSIGRRFRKTWKIWAAPKGIDVPIYQRLVLIFRLKETTQARDRVDTRSIYLKFFKDIPKCDLEMLLPGTSIRMTVLDRGRIWLPTLSGVTMTAWKIFQGGLSLMAGVTGSVAHLMLLGGTLGYGVKSYTGYLQTRQKYQLSLTESLYYQNLDNNAGVFHRLLDEAEEQECREALLAYFFLWKNAPDTGWSLRELDDAIEQFLRNKTSLDIDFEVDDAIAKLDRLGLASTFDGVRYTATPLPVALTLLNQPWEDRSTRLAS